MQLSKQELRLKCLEMAVFEAKYTVRTEEDKAKALERAQEFINFIEKEKS